MKPSDVKRFYESLYSYGTSPTEKNYWVYINACHVYKFTNVRWVFFYWADESSIYFHHTTLVHYLGTWHWIESSYPEYEGVHTGRVTESGFKKFTTPDEAVEFIKFSLEPILNNNKPKLIYENTNVALPCSGPECGLSTKLVLDLCRPKDLAYKLNYELYQYLSHEEQKLICPSSPGVVTPDKLVDRRFIIDNYELGAGREHSFTDHYAVAACGVTAHSYNLLDTDVEAHLVDLAVHPNFRHRGLGSEVVLRAIEYCRAMHYTTLYWYASIENRPSIALALHLGFSVAPNRSNGKMTVLKLKL